MDFRKTFQDESESIDESSGLWQRYIQSKAPPGTHYMKIGDGDFQLFPKDDESLQVKVIQSFPKEWKELGANDFDDYLELFYRNQKPMEVKLQNYVVAGNDVSKDEMTHSFTTENSIIEDKCILIPEKFPSLPDLPIKANGIIYNFKIERKPLLNLSKQLFETIDDGIFYFKLIVDEKKAATNIYLSYDFSRARSLEDLVNHKEMILKFHQGPIEIFKHKLAPFEKKARMDIEGYLKFYSRLLEISKCFNLEFDISKSLKKADILNCDRVYESFINKHFYLIAEEKVKTFTVTPDQKSLDWIRKKIMSDDTMNIYGYRDSKITILGIEIPCIEMYAFEKAKFSHESEANNIVSFTFDILGENSHYRRLLEEELSESDANSLIKNVKQNTVTLNK